MQMDDLARDIKRKIHIRKIAMENLGGDMDVTSSGPITSTGDNADNEKQRLYSELYDNIIEADQSRIQSGYSNIISSRKLGKFIVFSKKAIRKVIMVLFGWFIRPILDRQSHFNGKTINSVDLLRKILTLQEQEYLKKIKELECEIEKIKTNVNAADDLNDKMEYVLNRLNVTCDIDLLKQSEIDYFKFEDTYRGTRNSIKEMQRVYIPYFRDNWGAAILDIGCGRGEFLELMMENGINAHGVDIYQPFIDYCKKRGFSVHKEDALSYLHSLDDCSLGGIFMSQVVEHLSNDYIVALIKTAYKKLKPGCYFILETPNPDCLAAISEFNIDITHVKPVHYKALEFIFKEANFTSVERYHTQQSMYPLSAKHIDGGESVGNTEEFNEGIDNINRLLFGYRDYTLIAKK